MKVPPHVILAVFLRHLLVAAQSGEDPTPQGTTECRRYNKLPPECAQILSGNVSVDARADYLEDSTFEHLQELDRRCVADLTALVCYFAYTPCHSARGIKLPLCPEQCRRLEKSVHNCSDDLTEGNTSIDPFLQRLGMFDFNCDEPDQEDCVTLNVSYGESASNKLPEIIVLALLVTAGLLLVALLLVVLGAVTVCAQRRRQHRKSKVACSQQPNNVTTLRRLDSPNPSAMVEKVSTEEEPNDVQVARMITDRKRRHYVSLYTGSFIPYQHLELRSIIGEGAFGKVSEGVWKDPANNVERRVAIKTLRSFSSEQQLNTLFTESRLMRDFDHPNVMKFLGMCFDAPEGYPYIILPFMANGSLLEYLKRNSDTSNSTNGYPKGLELGALFQFCLDIVDGMVYLVQQKFVHRDLAARNCMVSETMSIMIGDFGLAEDLYSRGQNQQPETRQPVKWMPPESLKDGVSNERTDMWSYGVTCWEVFSLGRSPYPGIENHEILQHISSGGRLKKPSLCPDQLYDVVSGCWHYNSGDRPSFEDMAWTLRQFWNTQQQQL